MVPRGWVGREYTQAQALYSHSERASDDAVRCVARRPAMVRALLAEAHKVVACWEGGGEEGGRAGQGEEAAAAAVGEGGTMWSMWESQWRGLQLGGGGRGG